MLGVDGMVMPLLVWAVIQDPDSEPWDKTDELEAISRPVRPLQETGACCLGGGVPATSGVAGTPR